MPIGYGWCWPGNREVCISLWQFEETENLPSRCISVRPTNARRSICKHPKWVVLKLGKVLRRLREALRVESWNQHHMHKKKKENLAETTQKNRTCLLMKQPWSSVIIFKEVAKIKVKGVSQWLQVCTALKNTPSVQSTPPPPPFFFPPTLSFSLSHSSCSVFLFLFPFFPPE